MSWVFLWLMYWIHPFKSQWRSAIVVTVPKQHPPRLDKLRPISLTDIFAILLRDLRQNGLSMTLRLTLIYTSSGMLAEYQRHITSLILFIHYFLARISLTMLVQLSSLTSPRLLTLSFAINKLLALGVREAIVPWICSFLSNRRQCVIQPNTLWLSNFECWCPPRH